MTDNQMNIGQMTGSNFVKGDVSGNVISTSNSYKTIQKQSLAEAVAEIQRLLEQLEATNPTATETEQVAYLNIATKPDIRKRTIAALKEAGETAIDEFILDNKYTKIVKAAVKGWLQISS